MSRRETDRLLWELIDGSLTPDDRDRLEASLAADADARARLAEMRSLARMLDSVEEVPVPETLPAAVERALAASRAGTDRPAPWWLWLGELFAPRWRVRLAWAAVGLALGVGLGILAVADLRRSSAEDPSRYYGAMSQAGGLRLALIDGSATLVLSREGPTLQIDVVVDRRDNPPLDLEVLGNDLILQDLQSNGKASMRVGPEGGRVVVRIEAASRATLHVRAAGEGAVVGLRASVGESVLLERRIRLDEVPGS